MFDLCVCLKMRVLKNVIPKGQNNLVTPSSLFGYAQNRLRSSTYCFITKCQKHNFTFSDIMVNSDVILILKFKHVYYIKML